MAELESITPAEAKEMYLAQRRNEVAEETLQSHEYRLNPFVQWCEQEGITNLNNLTARSLHEYRLWRKEDGDQQLMDDCFRASGRMRSKWDEVHSSGGATYGEMTILKVCRTNSETFGGRYVE